MSEKNKQTNQQINKKEQVKNIREFVVKVKSQE